MKKKMRELEVFVSEVEGQTMDLKSHFKPIEIDSRDDFTTVVKLKKDIKLRIEVIKERFLGEKNDAYQEHKAICSLEKKSICHLVEIDESIEKSLCSFFQRIDSGELKNPGVGFEGFSVRPVFEVEVKDPLAFLKAALDGSAPMDCIKFDQVKLAEYASKFEGSFDVPGVEVKKSFKTSIRLRKGGKE